MVSKNPALIVSKGSLRERLSPDWSESAERGSVTGQVKVTVVVTDHGTVVVMVVLQIQTVEQERTARRLKSLGLPSSFAVDRNNPSQRNTTSSNKSVTTKIIFNSCLLVISIVYHYQ